MIKIVAVKIVSVPIYMLILIKIVAVPIYNCEATQYPDFILPGPLPFEEEALEPDPEDIVTEVNPKTVGLLIEALKEKDASVRSRSAWALGDIGDSKAIIPLKKTLKDPSAQVRATAVSSLGRIGGDEAVAAIIAATSDEDVRVRREATKALVKLKPGNALTSLITCLSDTDRLVRKYSIQGLGEIASVQALEPLRNLLEKDTSLRPEILSALTKVDKGEAMPVISGYFSDPSPLTRAQVCSSLAYLKINDYTALVKCFRDEHFYVRRSAVRAIAELKPLAEEVIRELALMLKDKDSSVRAQTCQTLAKINTEKGVQALGLSLTDKDKFVRRSAAKALGDIGRSAIDVLMTYLSSQSILARREAAWALGYTSDSGNERGISQLLKAMKDKDTALKRNSAWALGMVKSNVSVEGLFLTLSDSDTEVRRNSAWALGEIVENTAVPSLIKGLSDKERVVRAESARSLGKIADSGATGALLKALANVKDHYSIRREAARALGEIGAKDAAPALIRTVTEMTIPTDFGPSFDSSEVRAQAAFALSKIGTEEAIQALESCLNNKKYPPPLLLRKALAEVLTKLTGREYTYEKRHIKKHYFIEPLSD